mgnify:CR=1 FL=1
MTAANPISLTISRESAKISFFILTTSFRCVIILLEEGSRSPLPSFEKVDDNQYPADEGYDFNRELVEVLQYLDELFYYALDFLHCALLSSLFLYILYHKSPGLSIPFAKKNKKFFSQNPLTFCLTYGIIYTEGGRGPLFYTAPDAPGQDR